MSSHRTLRLLTILLLLAVILTTLLVLLSTPAGRQAMQDPHQLGQDFRAYVRAHRLLAPLAFLALYVLLALALLPLWWLQVLFGYGFGLFFGVVLGQAAATIAAALTVALSHFLTADFVHDKLESHRARLKKLDETLGNNGLLVVMAIRLTHFVPFAISNYLLGLTRVSVADAALGTLLGGIPAMTFYVTLGAHRHYLTQWRYWTALAALNCLLLVPLILRYLGPRTPPPPDQTPS